MEKINYQGPKFHPVGDLWGAARTEFLTSPERLGYEELAQKHNLQIKSVRKAAHEEGWAILRCSFLNDQLAKSDAAMVVLRAAKSSSEIIRASENVSIKLLQNILQVIDEVESSENAATTKANTLQVLSYTLLNVANAAKSLGIVGFGKELDEAGKSLGGGKWDSKLLQQINITVGHLQAKQTKEVSAEVVG